MLTMSSCETSRTEVHHGLNELPPDAIVFGRSAQMEALRHRLDKIAGLDMPVLIEGESGTGKDIIARMLHHRSRWASDIFVKVRCSCIPEAFEDFFDSSSGAVACESQATRNARHDGCCGSLFLDEIPETNAAVQTNLLRMLQESPFCRINLKRCKLDLRLICAANSSLEEAVQRGSFRRDLLYRVNVLTLHVSPLRERISDIPDLVNYFLQLFSKTYDCNAKPLSRRMMQSLLGYAWPGNIRELENLMKRYVLLDCDESACSELVSRSHKQAGPEFSQPGGISLKELTKSAVRELEREAILKVLEANHWNRKRAACVLNISYRALLYKLKEAGVVSAPAASSQLAESSTGAATGTA